MSHTRSKIRQRFISRFWFSVLYAIAAMAAFAMQHPLFAQTSNDRPHTRETTSDDESTSQQRGDRSRWFRRGGRNRNDIVTFERRSSSVSEAFREVVADATKSTVKIVSDNEQIALGVVVSKDGLIVTKASELEDLPVCVLPNRASKPADIIGINVENDLALLKIDATNLTPIQWNADDPLEVGTWLASSGQGDLPIAVGIVSVTPRKIAPPNGGLGVTLSDSESGPQIISVVRESPAAKAGLLPEDHITKVNKKSTPTMEELIETIKGFRPGERIVLSVLRGEKPLTIRATLTRHDSINPFMKRANYQNSLGGSLSDRRAGFENAMQHDTVLEPNQCGGPVIGLDGKALGVNIARAGRVASYAIPAALILPIIDELKTGNFKPEVVNKERIELLDEEITAIDRRIKDDLESDLKEIEQLLAKNAKDAAAAKQALETAQQKIKSLEQARIESEKRAKELETQLNAARDEKKELIQRKSNLEDGLSSS